MRKVRHQDLLLISKAKKEKLDSFSAGVSLRARTQLSIPDLIARATGDRLAFARSILLTAQRNVESANPVFRAGVSQGYYSMYHTLRAVCYYVHGGDDHEEHVTLPSKIPGDFPDRVKWENDLKRARYDRNRADYDPYPKSDRQFPPMKLSLLRVRC
jgi:hypothetical protein